MLIPLSSCSHTACPAFTTSFPSLPFLQVCFLVHPQSTSLQIECDPLIFPLHSLHRKDEERPTMQQMTVFVPHPTLPCILGSSFRSKQDILKGTKENFSKETVAAGGGEAEVNFVGKGCAMVVKTPRSPCFENFTPTDAQTLVYLLISEQDMMQKTAHISRWERTCVYLNSAFVFPKIIIKVSKLQPFPQLMKTHARS